jgi:hypothetical protein
MPGQLFWLKLWAAIIVPGLHVLYKTTHTTNAGHQGGCGLVIRHLAL